MQGKEGGVNGWLPLEVKSADTSCQLTNQKDQQGEFSSSWSISGVRLPLGDI